VIGTGAILFALKAGGIALTATRHQCASRSARRGSTGKACGDARCRAGSAPSPARLPDPLAAINAALSKTCEARCAADTARPADELNSDLVANVSSAEMDVLTSLADRRDALEQRTRELDLRANSSPPPKSESTTRSDN